MNNQYQLKDTSIVVEVVEILPWDIVAKRIDNGKVDTYPIQYFKKFFILLEEATQIEKVKGNGV